MAPADAPSYWGRSASEVAAYRAELVGCRDELRSFIDKENCAPILIRLAWHDAGTYDRAGLEAHTHPQR